MPKGFGMAKTLGMAKKIVSDPNGLLVDIIAHYTEKICVSKNSHSSLDQCLKACSSNDWIHDKPSLIRCIPACWRSDLLYLSSIHRVLRTMMGTMQWPRPSACLLPVASSFSPGPRKPRCASHTPAPHQHGDRSRHGRPIPSPAFCSRLLVVPLCAWPVSSSA